MSKTAASIAILSSAQPQIRDRLHIANKSEILSPLTQILSYLRNVAGVRTSLDLFSMDVLRNAPRISARLVSPETNNESYTTLNYYFYVDNIGTLGVKQE